MTALPDVTMKESEYGLYRTTSLPYEAAVALTREELAKEGFGVLTEIDVKATMRKKLDVGFPNYIILGACNPKLALQALSAEPDIGLLLPCNVVVSEAADGRTQVTALDPTVMFGRLVENPGVAPIAADVEARLTRVLDRVADAKR